MPTRMRIVAGAVVACLTLAVLSACGGGGEDVPTREDLFAGLLTPGDLPGVWQTEAAEQVAEGGAGPTPFQDNCPEVLEEPAWQAYTVLTAPGPDEGRTLQVIEFVLADDPAATLATYAQFTDAIVRCGERQAAQSDLPEFSVEDIDLGGIGDDHLAAHINLVQVDGAASALDEYLAIALDGSVMAALIFEESIPVPVWPGEVPDATLTVDEVGAVVATAIDRLSGRPTSLASPSATGDAVAIPPPWWNDAVFYEVFVRSFADHDGDGNGDLAGLIDRLDYLNDGDPTAADDLGVTALWLMPVMQSPTYHGYDTTDYRTVEEDYGTNEDFRRLVRAAHERGMRVVVDLMLNHTSSEHPWFMSSATGPESTQRDWYVWREDDPGETTSWGTPAWHESDGAYYLGLFWEGMPDLNFRNPDVTEEMYDVARFWIEDMGVDGFRLDAVRHLIEDGSTFEGTAQTHEWLADWAAFVDAEAPDFLTVGEVWDDTTVVAPYVTEGEVDIAFEFTLADAVLTAVERGDPASLDRALSGALAAYPPGQFATFLTNHDQNRVMSRLDGAEAEARLAATLLLTLPGVPFIYYGEEIGMTGEKPDERIRTPMQWSDEANAGFSTGTLWEPVNTDHRTVNVAAQDDDGASLLSLYRRLIHLRTEHVALRTGGLQALAGTCSGTYAYLRTAPHLQTGDGQEAPPHPQTSDSATPGESVLVVVNLAPEERRDCSFTVAQSALASGDHVALDVLTGEHAPDLTADERGGVRDYVPVDSLPAQSSAVLVLTQTPDN